jgi:hypothetical protein
MDVLSIAILKGIDCVNALCEVIAKGCQEDFDEP